MPAPTPPPAVNCDRTPPPALLPSVPPLAGADDLPALDAWIAQVIGIYQGELTIRRAEHRCMDALRSKGVIR